MQVDDVVVFQGEEDQQKFFDWLDQNSDGYFVNVAPVYDGDDPSGDVPPI
jgi:hypothetical protein